MAKTLQQVLTEFGIYDQAAHDFKLGKAVSKFKCRQADLFMSVKKLSGLAERIHKAYLVRTVRSRVVEVDDDFMNHLATITFVADSMDNLIKRIAINSSLNRELSIEQKKGAGFDRNKLNVMLRIPSVWFDTHCYVGITPKGIKAKKDLPADTMVMGHLSVDIPPAYASALIRMYQGIKNNEKGTIKHGKTNKEKAQQKCASEASGSTVSSGAAKA